MNQRQSASKRASQTPSKSRGTSSRPNGTIRNSSTGKRKTLTSKLDYKRIGLGFVTIGILIGAIVGYAAWHSLTVNAMKSWTYIGSASQFQTPGAANTAATSNHIAVAVFACKQQVGEIAGAAGTYTVKARAKVTHNSVSNSFGNPRLEIVSDGSATSRYASSPAFSSTVEVGTETATPYTDSTMRGTATLYYALNNFYENNNGGTGLYAFGLIAKLNNC